ncbi:MAG: S8 family serine peptidase [Betaproteobacteria bacterium]
MNVRSDNVMRRPTRALLAAIVGFAAALTATAAPAATVATIEAVVVKFRDDAVPPALVSLRPQDLDRLASRLQIGFMPLGRALDGSFRLALQPTLPVEDARAALNRLRLDPGMLWAEFARPDAVTAAASTLAKSATVARPTNQMIVRYRDPARSSAARAGAPIDQAQVGRFAALAGQPLAWLRAGHDGSGILRLFRFLPADTVAAIAARIAQEPDIEYAQPDYIKDVSLVPTDPCYPSAGSGCVGQYQWDLFDPVGGINMPAAWDVTTGSAPIVVSVIDTGALYSHPDLAGRLLPGYDMIADCAVANDGSSPCSFSPLPYISGVSTPAYTSRDGDATDPGDWVSAAENNPSVPLQPPFYDWFAGCGAGNSSWHGTHVAGTIAAIANNGIGIAGINWVSQVMPIRALGKCGGYTSDIADAIVWAAGGSISGVPDAATPAKVMNLSLGGYLGVGKSCPVSDTTTQNAVNAANTLGAVVVVAAGNSNHDAVTDSPASCNGVITVAATGKTGSRASYSNYGTLVEIAAPGGDGSFSIVSSLNAGTTAPGVFIYAGYQGTSMATPHVTGVVSLMFSVKPTLTPSQVLSMLQTSARAFPAGSTCTASAGAVTATVKYCGAGIVDAYAAVVLAGGTTLTALTSSTNPSTVGATVTFTATVTGSAPTGSVAFTESGSPLAGCGTVPLVAGSATCTIASLAVGTHAIVATYSGDASNATSASAPLTQTVNKAAAVTTLVSSPNPSPLGTAVTFTATVTGAGPTGTVAFTDGAGTLAGCGTVALAGGQAQCPANGLASGTHGIVATYGGDGGNAGSASPTLSQVVNGPATNVALASNGGVASASSSRAGFAPAAAIDNDRKGTNGGWSDNTPNSYSDWLQVNFAGSKTIDRVVVYTLQDNSGSPVEPTDSMTFSLYGVTDFSVRAWDGVNWYTVASTSGNNLVKRSFTFSAITTDRIRIKVTKALGGYSRITEVEAWAAGGAAPAPTTTVLASSLNPSTVGGSVTFTATVNGSAPTGSVAFTDNGATISGCGAVAFTGGSTNSRTAQCATAALVAGTRSIVATYGGDSANTGSTSPTLSQIVNPAGGGAINVALASNGGVASASSSRAGFAPASAIDNDRKGTNGGWSDNTPNSYSDWLQVNFAGSKTIDRVVVYTLQDNSGSPVEPTDSMTFSLYGVTDFSVRAWDGVNWYTVASTSGNNLVKRSFTFSAITTDRIRIKVTKALGGYSRITELEAWGN